MKNLRWTNYASVTAKTPEQRAGSPERIEQAFAALWPLGPGPLPARLPHANVGLTNVGKLNE